VVTKRGLFGTSGIRGDAEKLFTKQFCFDIGRAFALFLNEHDQSGGIAIGMDPRGSSPRIKRAVEAGLVFEGREVFDQGATSVPAINQILLVSSNYAGSIMISGSHIKPHLNGIKFFAFREEILKKHEKQINDTYERIKGKQKYKQEVEFEIHDENRASQEYIEVLVKLAKPPFPSWKVVVDPGDGAQSDIMPEVLRRLGLRVIEMNATIQGEFYSRDTEVKGDFKELQKKVLDEKANFGIGYDSDGDRVVFIDEKGDYIPGDYTGALIAKGLPLKTVVTPINTSQVVDHIGKKVVRTKVGSPFVVQKMKELKVDFGFEANGGGIFSEMMSRDGGRTTVAILNILSKRKVTLSKLMTDLPKFYLARTKVDYEWDLKEKILTEAKKEFKGVKIEEIDGLKIWIDDNTWILFRSSSNAPEFRVFAESKSEKTAEKLMNDGVSFVKNLIKKK